MQEIKVLGGERAKAAMDGFLVEDFDTVYGENYWKFLHRLHGEVRQD